MLQIKNTLGGGKPEGMYVWKKHEIGSGLNVLKKSVSTLPFNFSGGSAVVLNGEIHILGSGYSGDYIKHYKWNGTSWTSVSTLPFHFYNGAAVVLNGEIHILGGIIYPTKHYKFDGSSWSEVSTLPYSFYDGSAVVLNGEIHILGSSSSSSEYTNHYKFDGTSWINVSTLPYFFYSGSAVVFNNEIHILGSNYDSATTAKYHYKFNGSSWASVSTLPYSFYDGSAVVFNNEIHLLGGSNNTTKHYKWDGSSWTSVSTLPYTFYHSPAVIFDNGIHILGSSTSDYSTAHYLIIGFVLTYTFLDYIVSDKETAYPDGGEKGGYWYEKIFEITPQMFGCTKMAIDYKIWASASGSIRYAHSLGEAPKVAILTCGGNAPSTGSGVLTDICLGSYWVHNRLVDGKISTGSNYTDASLEKTSVSHGHINGDTFAGVKYTIITMA